MLTIEAFNLFEAIYVMTEGRPGGTTNTILYYIYTQAFERYRMGYASAMAWILFAILFVVTILQFNARRKKKRRSATRPGGRGGKNMKRKKRISTVILYIVLIFLAVIMIYPFVWSVTASFKTNQQIYGGNPLDLIPKPFTLNNYKRVLELLPFGRFLLNSMFLATVVPAISIILASMAAYAFARLEFKGRDFIFMLLLGVMMLPGHVTLIPRYALMIKLGWVNRYIA